MGVNPALLADSNGSRRNITAKRFPFNSIEYRPFKAINPYRILNYCNYNFDDPFLFRNIIYNRYGLNPRKRCDRRDLIDDFDCRITHSSMLENDYYNDAKDSYLGANDLNVPDIFSNNRLGRLHTDRYDYLDDARFAIRNVVGIANRIYSMFMDQIDNELTQFSQQHGTYKSLEPDTLNNAKSWYSLNTLNTSLSDESVGKSTVYFNDKPYYKVDFNMPNIRKEDVKINIYNNVLKVSASSKHENNSENFMMSTSFKHSVSLPENLDTNSAKATFRDNKLSIIIPKTENNNF